MRQIKQTKGRREEQKDLQMKRTEELREKQSKRCSLTSTAPWNHSDEFRSRNGLDLVGRLLRAKKEKDEEKQYKENEGGAGNNERRVKTQREASKETNVFAYIQW